LTIENTELASFVTCGAETLGINLPPEACRAFETYYELLDKRGKNVNLTSITGVSDVARLHFLDSIALLKTAQFTGARVIDIGSGAGFPGIPLKIAEPSIDLTLLDATGKRVAFLAELNAALFLDAACIHERAEIAAHLPDLRESFDIVVSRAVARLNILCELCLPFVRVGGTFIAMKDIDSAQEISQARSAIDALGTELADCVDYVIPCTDTSHRAVVLFKTSGTPVKYPRRFARIQKVPL